MRFAPHTGQISVFCPGWTSAGSHGILGFMAGIIRHRRYDRISVTLPEVVLVAANCMYATSYAATRLTLDEVGPATLAWLRLAIGALLLLPLARAGRDVAAARRMTTGDRWRIAWMGILGFALAVGLSHWGIAWSTATNAALLITVEPIALIVLSPVLLGERLRRREQIGAAAALAGAGLVVVNGVPGVTHELAPHWRGDLLLVLAGIAYASYSLIGREVLMRHRPTAVTAWSILAGAIAMLPPAAVELAQSGPPRVTPSSVAGTLYLAVVVTALGYLAWNYALQRVSAPRAAIFLNLQPLVGALLGVLWLGDALTRFTVAGGILILVGLGLTVKAGGTR
jgi:drug/metabolite transporter (DMT)-like permease